MINKIPSIAFGAVLAALSVHSGLGYAAVSQAPLFIGGKATPNLIFSMDESWSMAWGYMPDQVSLSGGTLYGNPWATGPGDSGDGGGRRWGIAFHPDDVSTCDGCVGTAGSVAGSYRVNTFVASADANGVATDLIAARLRSSAFNTIYYNPSVRYDPWFKEDGTPYAAASPGAAPLHPLNPNAKVVSLVGLQTFSNKYWCGSTQMVGGDYCQQRASLQMAPAVWFDYTGPVDADGKPTYAGLTNEQNFRRVQIMDNASFSRPDTRTDCALIAAGTGTSCTQAEEYQNFANWFTYNRTRMFLAIAATTKAFSEFDDGLRLGWARMHYGSTDASSTTIEQMVKGLDLTTKQEFFAWLKKMSGSLSSSQLYGSKNANASTGHFFDGGTFIRRMTEDAGRYYSSDHPYRLIPDDSGSALLGCRKNYQLLMSDGTESDNSWSSFGRRASSRDTLEAIADYYYRTDLRGDLANNVPPDSVDPLTHQHLVNFMVGLGVDVPEMESAAAVSKGGYLSASNVQEFSDSLSAMLRGVVVREGSSSSSIAANSTRLDSGTLIYQASFDSDDWTGRIRAYRPNATTGLLDQDSPFWDTNTTLSRSSAGSRVIFTPAALSGSSTLLTSTVNFNWASLTNAQKDLLKKAGEGDYTNAQKRLNWIRGSAADEGTLLRRRSAVLGDIINSDPFFVGSTEDFGFAQATSGLSETARLAYETYLNTATPGGKKGRREVIYVGSNDGMLHAFDANTGAEVFAYLPAGAFAKLRDVSDPAYVHQYLMDGSPRAQDVYLTIGGVTSWRTVLVAATGAGGKSVFALDVTNPNSPSLLWEYSRQDGSVDQTGLTMSAPSIVRAANGSWLAVFGNGYDKSSGNVKLTALNLATGALVKSFDTGVSAVGNGLASVAPIDIDGDRITDYIYGGDLQGNLWRFSLLGNNTNGWDVDRLFTATDAYGVRQPITVRPDVGRHPEGGVLVYFGTGKYFEQNDNIIGNDPQVQSFYAVRDQNFQTTGNPQFQTVTRSDLLGQRIEFEGNLTRSTGGSTEYPVRVVSANGAGTKPDDGWVIDLVSPVNGAEGERSVSRPILRYGRIIFTTIIPEPDLCGQGGGSWLMELDAITGGRLEYSVLDINGDLLIDNGDFVLVVIDEEEVKVPVSGRYTDEMIKTPGIVDAGEVEFKYTSGSSGTVGVIREKGAGDILGRQSWRQMQ